MKVLIWILSAFVIVLVNELIGMAVGFKLGYVLVFCLVSAVATALTKAFLGEDKAGKKKKDSRGKNSPPVNNPPIPGGWTCPSCGMNHEPSTNFCDHCGTPKTAAAPAPAVEMTRPQSPAMEMTRPQPIEPVKTPEPPATQSWDQGFATQPQPVAPAQPVVPMAPVQPVAPVAPVQPPQPMRQPQQPPVQQPQYNPYGAPQGYPQQPPVQQPRQPQQQTGSIKFYVSSLNTEVNVTRSSFTVGRDATSDLSLARLPNAKYIARRQATFFCSGGKWYIRDENSTNGTFLNNKQLPGGQPHALNQGDFISFAGKETLIVQSLSK